MLRPSNIFLFFLFLIPSIAQAHSYAFCRLVKRDVNGNILKTVDLISDCHLLKNLDESERTLVDTLDYLDNNPAGHSVRLLWEVNEESIYQVKNLFINDVAIKYFNRPSSEKQKIKFMPADTYRSNHEAILQLVSAMAPTEKSVKETFNFLATLAYNTNEDVKNDLAQISEPELREKIALEWAKFCKGTITPIYEKLIAPFGELSMQEFCEKKEYDELKTAWDNDLLSQVMNYELIAKIAQTQQGHDIAYVGGTHCSDTAKQLIAQYGFSQEINLGVENSYNFAAPLNKDIWNFLKKPFENSSIEDRNRKQLPESTLGSFFTMIAQKDSTSSSGNPAEELLKQAKEAYVNLANVQRVVGDQFGESALHTAIKKGDLSTIMLLLENSAVINNKDQYGNTSLHEVIAMGNMDVLNLLLARSPCPYIENNEGKLPEQMTENPAIQKLLQTYEAEYLAKIPLPEALIVKEDIEDKEQDTLLANTLNQAIDDNNIALVKLLIKRGISPIINKRDELGNTFLHAAGQQRRENIFKLLVEAGADLAIENEDGKTAEQELNFMRFTQQITNFENEYQYEFYALSNDLENLSGKATDKEIILNLSNNYSTNVTKFQEKLAEIKKRGAKLEENGFDNEEIEKLEYEFNQKKEDITMTLSQLEAGNFWLEEEGSEMEEE